MARILQPAKITGGGVFDVQSMSYVDAGADFIEGDILTADASDEGDVEKYSTTPLVSTATGVVVGIALEDKDSHPGFEMGHNSQVQQVTGLQRLVSAVVPNRNTKFSALIYNDASVSDYTILVGNLYDLDLDTQWKLDANVNGSAPGTGAAYVEQVISTVGPNSENIAIFTFVAAVIAAPSA